MGKVEKVFEPVHVFTCEGEGLIMIHQEIYHDKDQIIAVTPSQAKAVDLDLQREIARGKKGGDAAGEDKKEIEVDKVKIITHDEHALTGLQSAFVDVFVDGKHIATISATVKPELGADNNSYPVVKLNPLARAEPSKE